MDDIFYEAIYIGRSAPLGYQATTCLRKMHEYFYAEGKPEQFVVFYEIYKMAVGDRLHWHTFHRASMDREKEGSS